VGHAGASAKSLNDAPWETLSARLSRPISAPHLTGALSRKYGEELVRKVPYSRQLITRDLFNRNLCSPSREWVPTTRQRWNMWMRLGRVEPHSSSTVTSSSLLYSRHFAMRPLAKGQPLSFLKIYMVIVLKISIQMGQLAGYPMPLYSHTICLSDQVIGPRKGVFGWLSYSDSGSWGNRRDGGTATCQTGRTSNWQGNSWNQREAKTGLYLVFQSN